MDITQVKRMLADRAQAVAEMLLPDGRKDGSEWRVGSVDGERGKSLGVHLTGSKAGVWFDFARSEGGDLIDLWASTRGLTISDALRDAKRWLGVSDPIAYREPRRTFRRPPKPACKAISGGALDYLVSHRRIPKHVLATYKVAADGNDIIFPFLLPGGELAMAKARKAEDGAATKPTTGDCEPILFGWQAIPDDAREIILSEGEIDSLTWAAYGWPAMSVPYGGGKGGKQSWIESEYDRLDRFERIYISTDMDKPGDEAAEEIASRLGRHRCYRVSLPHKDANECLMAGVSKEEMDRAVAEAANLDPEGLLRPSDYAEQVTQLFWPELGYHVGYGLPYERLANKIHFRPAEMTAWGGATGMGKSLILSDCIPHWIKHGSRVCLASFEMKCSQTLRRMVKQAGGVDRPTEEYITQILAWLDRGLLLYDRVGKAGLDELLAIFGYARAKYGCDQFIIDSLMRLGIPQDDYTAQQSAAERLVTWAIEHDVHVHLVSHARKALRTERETGPPEGQDLKGAMEIGANAANIILVWRNRKLEDDIRNATAEELVELEAKPGVIMVVDKQRNGDFTGKVGLWFDLDTYRYHSTGDRREWRREYVD